MHRSFPGSIVLASMAWLAPFVAARAQDTWVLSAEGNSTPTVAAPAPRFAGLAPFLELLSPHGTWLDLPAVGLAWRPEESVVGPAFVPYTTHGHWIDSDVGWVFESDFPWGYATFHYGRWLRDATYGWVWTPDTEWGAAWVEWRTAGERVGWVPLPPVGFEYTVALAPLYVVVPVVYLADPAYARFVVSGADVAGWVDASTPCERWWDDGARGWPAGPRPIVAGPRGGGTPRQPRGVVAVRPPPRGVVAVRPPEGEGAPRGRIVARAPTSPGGRASVPVLPAPWGEALPAPPPDRSLSSAHRRFGVQRTVLPARDEGAWWGVVGASGDAAAERRSPSVPRAERPAGAPSPGADAARIALPSADERARPDRSRTPRPSEAPRILERFTGSPPDSPSSAFSEPPRVRPAPRASESGALAAPAVFRSSGARIAPRPQAAPGRPVDPRAATPRVQPPSPALRGPSFAAPRR